MRFETILYYAALAWLAGIPVCLAVFALWSDFRLGYFEAVPKEQRCARVAALILLWPATVPGVIRFVLRFWWEKRKLKCPACGVNVEDHPNVERVEDGIVFHHAEEEEP